MKTRFIINNRKDSNGESVIYLSVTFKQKRIRVSLDLKIVPEKFDAENQTIIISNKQDKDIQLILDNINAKITQIKTYYRLSDKHLSVDKFIEEFKNNVPRGEFISYFTYELEKDRSTLKDSTYKRHQAIIRNLQAYKKEVYFSDITEDFFHSYKSYFRKTRSANTYYSNLKIIKKYLRRALKSGVRLQLDLDNVKVKNIRSNRVHLNTDELKKLYNFYFSEFILPGERIPLGTFLFACYSGLRISDLQKLTREQILSGLLEFIVTKTEKDKPYEHKIKVSKKAMLITKHTPELFSKKISDQKINEYISKVCKKLHLKKTVTIHVARHTFATNYLRAGGKVEQLQILLGHSSINETMIYVHIVNAEEDDSIFLLDNLF